VIVKSESMTGVSRDLCEEESAAFVRQRTREAVQASLAKYQAVTRG
jgi:hypothetical protein